MSSKLVRRRYKLVQNIADPSIVHRDELSELLVDPDLVDAGPLDVEGLEELLLSARPSLGELPLADRGGGEAESVQVPRALPGQEVSHRDEQVRLTS